MADVENQVDTETSRAGPRLVLRTVFHSAYLLLDLGCLLYAAVVMTRKVRGENLDPLLRDMKDFTPAFFTNWNFIIIALTSAERPIKRYLDKVKSNPGKAEEIRQKQLAQIKANRKKTFQITFLMLSLVYDVLEWVEHSEGVLARRVKYWRDILFCSMVVPYTAFVTSMFWMVYSIDRELVFPKVYDQVVPWWFNHCVHTNTAVMVVLETLLQARPHPTNRLIEEFLYWTIALLYGVVYYTIYFTTSRWLYKVFGVMTWWQVCLYQLYIWLSSYLVYRLQFPINRLIHGCDESVEEEKDIQRINEVETHEQDQESKIKHGEGRWSLKLRSIKGQLEGTRL